MNPIVMKFIERLENAFHEGDPRATEKTAEKDNVKSLQEQYRALVRGDVAAFAATLADDVELDILGGPDLPFAGRWKGRDEVIKAVVLNFSLLEDQQPEVESVVAQGDTVVVFARERGRFKATGREYDIRWAQWFTFRDGLLFRMRELAEEGPLVAAAR
jgi:ketosteroid isomerase-like protein